MKSLQTDGQSWTSGNSRGIRICPLASLNIAIPAVITTNTTARATDRADVYLSESEMDHEGRKEKKQAIWSDLVTDKDKQQKCSDVTVAYRHASHMPAE